MEGKMTANTKGNIVTTLRACGVSLALCLVGVAGTALGQDATYSVKLLTPEIALKLARATLEACRKEGFQVSVAVTDRFGVTQVLLRDRFAGPHTVEAATNKAWTAVSFRQDTLGLAKATTDPANSGLRHFRRVVALGGGVPVEAGVRYWGRLASRVDLVGKQMTAVPGPGSKP
jgi:uncharacterized protein GlcG (DUF336 family)